MVLSQTLLPNQPERYNPRSVPDAVMAAKKVFFEQIGYEPTPAQWELHWDGHRFQLIAGGEQAGKSLYSARGEGAFRIFSGGFGQEYWLVAADYERCTPEFNYLTEVFDSLGLVKFASKNTERGKILIGLPSMSDAECTKVIPKSANDPRKIAMTAPAGQIGCEFSQVDFNTFRRCRGRAGASKGWMILAGTFEGSLGWYPEYFKKWQIENAESGMSFSLPTWTNSHLYPGGRNDPEILAMEAEFPEAWFKERFAGVPCPPAGAVFGHDFSNDVHVNDDLASYDPDYPVYIAVDPGFSHANVVEFVQLHHGKVFLIDELYNKGLHTSGEQGVIGAFNQMTTDDGVRYAEFITNGTIDIAGTANRPEGPPVAQIWLEETGILLNSNKIGIDDGINQLKTYLNVNPISKEPKLYVNSKCKGFISECGGCPNPHSGKAEVYSYRMNNEQIITGLIHLHDDAVKAVWYFLVDHFGYAQTKLTTGVKQRQPFQPVMKR